METTFGHDNPRINVISGDILTSRVVVTTLSVADPASHDPTDSASALSAFLQSRKNSVGAPPEPTAREDGFRRVLAVAPAPASAPQEPATMRKSPPDSQPAPRQRAAFRTGTGTPILTAPPVRAGRMIELD
jgi:hypothetical protein